MKSKIDKIEFKKIILGSLLIAFITSVISDVTYGKAALAEEYMIGQFLSTISHLSLSLVTIFVIMWIMFKLVFKYFFENFVFNENIHGTSDDSLKPTKDSVISNGITEDTANTNNKKKEIKNE